MAPPPRTTSLSLSLSLSLVLFLPLSLVLTLVLQSLCLRVENSSGPNYLAGPLCAPVTWFFLGQAASRKPSLDILHSCWTSQPAHATKTLGEPFVKEAGSTIG